MPAACPDVNDVPLFDNDNINESNAWIDSWYSDAPDDVGPLSPICNISDGESHADGTQSRVDSRVAAIPAPSSPLVPSTPSPDLPSRSSHSLSSLAHSLSSTKTKTSTKSAAAPRRKRPTRIHRPANSNHITKRWRYLKDHEKELVALDAAEASGAWAFRLTFSLEKEQELRKAAAAGKPILQMMADSISHQFRRRNLPVPAFGFVLEEAPGTYRLHIHGVHAAPHDPDLYRQTFVDAGDRKDGKASGSQFWHDVGYTLNKYFGYSRKDEDDVKRRLDLDGVTFINAQMKRHGREWHHGRLAAKKPRPELSTPPAMSIEEHLADLDDIPDTLDDELAPEATPDVPATPEPVFTDEEMRELYEWIDNRPEDAETPIVEPAPISTASPAAPDTPPATKAATAPRIATTAHRRLVRVRETFPALRHSPAPHASPGAFLPRCAASYRSTAPPLP